MSAPVRTTPASGHLVPAKRSSNRRWWLAALLLGGVSLSIGCNPATLSYFLFVHDATFPPEMMCFTEHKKNPKVVILASNSNPHVMNMELFNADQLLERAFHHVLTKRYKDHRDKVQLISITEVQKFKTKNPNWKVMGLEEIGNHFEADYVISLEINKLSLYEDGPRQMLFRGKAEVHVSALDMKEGTEVNKSYTCTYPGRGPEATDTSPGIFGARFINKMARDMACWFSNYPTHEKHDFD